MLAAASSRSRAALTARNNLTFLGGEGPVMLFCHGFGTDQTLWRLLTPLLDLGRRLVLLDLVGSGGSDIEAYRTGKYGSIEGYAEDLLEVCRAFDLQDVTLVGHSVGSMIALLACLEDPGRFRGLVMIGASPRYLNDEGYVGGFTEADLDELLAAFDRNREAWCGQMAAAAMAHAERPELAEEVGGLFRKAKPAILRHFARTTFTTDCRPRLAGCRKPVLLLQSRRDVIVPVAASEYLRDALPASELAWLRTEGHFAQLSAPLEVAERLLPFVERLETVHA